MNALEKTGSTAPEDTKDGLGEIIRLDSLARDVTRRAEHSEKLDRLLRMCVMLGRINGVFVRTRDKHALYREICRLAVDEGGFSLAWVGNVDAETQEVTVSIMCGHDVESPDLHRLPAEQKSLGAGGLLGLAVRSAKPAISNDIPNDAHLVRLPEIEGHGYRSVAVLPLKPDAHVNSVIVLCAAEKDFFHAEEVHLLEELAGSIAFALACRDKATRLDHLAYYDALTGLATGTYRRDRHCRCDRASRRRPIVL